MWSIKSEELTRSVQQGLWPWKSHCVGSPASYSRAVGRGAREGVAVAQHPELLISSKPRLKAKPRVLLSPGYTLGSPEHSVRVEAGMAQGVPSLSVCPVAVPGLQSFHTHGGAASCFNPWPGAPCHTAAHSLLAEDGRVHGETTCSLQFKNESKSHTCNAGPTPTSTNTATAAAVGSSFSLLPSPTSH